MNDCTLKFSASFSYFARESKHYLDQISTQNHESSEVFSFDQDVDKK